MKYPKLTVLAIIIVLSYLIFSNETVAGFFSRLGNLGYLGAFIAGLFYTFGFTSPISAGIFLTLNPHNIWIAGILGGFGAMLCDLLIFDLIKFSFMDEFKLLSKTRFIRHINNFFKRDGLLRKIKTYLLYGISGFLIASPLPDEAGIIMLAGLTRLKQSELSVIGFICNSIGILILLLI